MRFATLEVDIENEAVVRDPEGETVGAIPRARRLEMILFEQVKDRDLALLLDLARAAYDRVFVKVYGDKTIGRAFCHGSLMSATKLTGLRPLPVKPCGDRPGVSFETFAFSQQNGVRPQRRNGTWRTAQKRRSFHEVEHGKARGEARGAMGRQHVIGPGDVVAHCLRRVGSKKNRTCVLHTWHQRLRVASGNLKMF